MRSDPRNCNTGACRGGDIGRGSAIITTGNDAGEIEIALAQGAGRPYRTDGPLPSLGRFDVRLNHLVSLLSPSESRVPSNSEYEHCRFLS